MHVLSLRRRVALTIAGISLVVAGIESAGVAARPTGPAARIRKSVSDLTPHERRAFVDAVLTLKRTPSPENPSLSYYDQFVLWHKELYRCDPLANALGHDHHQTMAHGGPLFLPWHRAFLLKFEDALRDVTGKNITVPYWDWADGRGVSAVFADDFMGPTGDHTKGYVVTSGPFGKDAGRWELKIQPEGLEYAHSTSKYLTRNMGTWLGSSVHLPPQVDVSAALEAPQYDVAPYHTGSDPTRSFRNAIEGFTGQPGPSRMVCGPDRWMMTLEGGRLHNQVHVHVGGSFLSVDGTTDVFGTMVLPTSPNDPVFFLHHANIDRLWAQWQGLHPRETFEPQATIDVPMAPFGLTPRHMLHLSGLGYRYS